MPAHLRATPSGSNADTHGSAVVIASISLFSWCGLFSPFMAAGGLHDMYVAVDGPLRELEEATVSNALRFGRVSCQVFGVIYAPRPLPPPDSSRTVRKDHMAHFLLAMYPCGETPSQVNSVSTWVDRNTQRTWGVVHAAKVEPFLQLVRLARPVLLHDLHQCYLSWPAEGARVLSALEISGSTVLCKLGEVRPSFSLMLRRLECVLQTHSPCVQRRDVVPAHEVLGRIEFFPASTFPKAMAQRLPLLSTPMPATHTALSRLIRASLRCTQECREEFAVSSVQHLLPVDMLEDASVAFLIGSDSVPPVDRNQLAYGFFLFIAEDTLSTWAAQPLATNVLHTLLTDMHFGIITSCSHRCTRLRLMTVHTPPDPSMLVGLPADGESAPLDTNAASVPQADEDAERPLRSRLGALLILMSAHEQYFTYHALYRAVHLQHPDREAAIHAFDPPFAGLARPTQFVPQVKRAWKKLSTSEHLTEGQKRAAAELAVCSGSVTVLQGCPGCGKSFVLLRLARALCESDDRRLLVVYMAPTRLLRDEMALAAATRDVFPAESQRLVLGRADDWGEDSYTKWLFCRLEELCPLLHRALQEAEQEIKALPPTYVVDPALQELAKEHHDRTLELYVREWQARKDGMLGSVRFVAMTRTLGMRHLGKLTSAGDLLKDRSLVIIADEIEDWMEAPLVAAAGHAQLLLCSGDSDQTLRPVQRMLSPDHLGDLKDLLEPMHGAATSAFDALRGDNVPVVRLPVTRRFGPLLLAGYRAMATEGSEKFECDPNAPQTAAGMIIFPSCCWFAQLEGKDVQPSLVGRVLPGEDVLAVLARLLLELHHDHDRILVLTLYDHVREYVKQALETQLFNTVLEIIGGDVSSQTLLSKVDVRTIRSARGATGDAVIFLAHKRYVLDDGMQGQFVDDVGMRRVAFSRATQHMFVFAEEAVRADVVRDGKRIPGFGRLETLWPTHWFNPTTGSLGKFPRGVQHRVDPIALKLYGWNWCQERVRPAVTALRAQCHFRHRPIDARVPIVAQIHDSKHRRHHADRILKALHGRADARVPTVATEDDAQKSVEAHNQRCSGAATAGDSPIDAALLRWLEKAQRYAVPCVHWHIGDDAPGPIEEPRRFPNLVAIPFFKDFLPWSKDTHEWDEHLHLAKLFCPPDHRLRLVRHKGHTVQTQHSMHYWKECHSERFAVAVERVNVASEQRVRLYAYHGMGTKRMLPCLAGIVLRVADMTMVQHIARQLGAYWPLYALRPEDCVIWDRTPEGTSSVLAAITEAWHDGLRLRGSHGTRLPLQLRSAATQVDQDAPSGTGWCG